MAQTIAKEAAKPKICHFHGPSRGVHVGTHIVRVTCPKCSVYQVIYACTSCTDAIRAYNRNESSVTCNTCAAQIKAQQAWAILGEA